MMLQPYIVHFRKLLSNIFFNLISHLGMFFFAGMRPVIFYTGVFGIILSGCSPYHKPTPPTKSLNKAEAEAILSDMRVQEFKTGSFISSGNISVKDWKWESQADTLIVAIKNPFKVKIEIVHPWGKPVLNILIDNDRLKVLSFQERRQYIGEFTPGALERFFPGIFLDKNLVWSILRGYPPVLKHDSITTDGTNRIMLKDILDISIQIFDLCQESLQPERVYFPPQNLVIEFSDFKNDEEICYASQVRLTGRGGNKDLLIKNSKMIFNPSIPDGIFIMEKPPGYEVVPLDGIF